MIVQKYGGTSLGSISGLTRILEIITETHAKKIPLYVVVSAISRSSKVCGATSRLLGLLNVDSMALHKGLAVLHEQHLELARVLLKGEFLKRFDDFVSEQLHYVEIFLTKSSGRVCDGSDVVLAVGERFSAFLLVMLLRCRGEKAEYMDLSDVLPGRDWDKPLVVAQAMKKQIDSFFSLKQTNHIIVCTGFLGPYPSGILKSLGRGYTDYTATILALDDSAELQIWKGVSGICSADPFLTRDARSISTIRVSEALNLSFLGAQIIHPMALDVMRSHYCVDKKVWVKNIWDKNSSGTFIVQDSVLSALKEVMFCITSIVRMKCSLMSFHMSMEEFQKMNLPVVMDWVLVKDDLIYVIDLDDTLLLRDYVSKGHLVENACMIGLVGIFKDKVFSENMVIDCLKKHDLSPFLLHWDAKGKQILCFMDEKYLQHGVDVLHEHFIVRHAV